MLFRALPNNTCLPIVTGENRGMKWHVHSFNLGAWAGWYEQPVQRCFRQCIKPGMVVYDCGAAAVFFTLLAVRLTGDPSCVLAIEPLPSQLQYLRKNLEANQFDGVRIIEAAIAAHNGSAAFRGTALLKTTSSEIDMKPSDKGGFQVSVRTLDSIAEEWMPPDFMKIDVETAEVVTLEGSRKLLATKRPIICLSCHGGPLFPACARILKEYAYNSMLLEGSYEYGVALWLPE